MSKYTEAKYLFHHNNLTFEQEKMMSKTIDEALEKQIPKKAKYKIVGNGWNDWAEGKCPVCGVDTKNTPIYCPYCGQAIDWGDTDE